MLQFKKLGQRLKSLTQALLHNLKLETVVPTCQNVNDILTWKTGCRKLFQVDSSKLF